MYTSKAMNSLLDLLRVDLLFAEACRKAPYPDTYFHASCISGTNWTKQAPIPTMSRRETKTVDCIDTLKSLLNIKVIIIRHLL